MIFKLPRLYVALYTILQRYMNKIIAFCFYLDMFILGKQTTIFKNNVYDW